MDTIGKRIAYLRQKYGWTQQSLADRLAMSRVAISHIEMDLTIPSERSIILMAGLFKLTPLELVDQTTYPKAKSERLPVLTTIFTQVELSYALLQNDLDWLRQLFGEKKWSAQAQRIQQKWYGCLEELAELSNGEHEQSMIAEMFTQLRELSVQLNHPLS